MVYRESAPTRAAASRRERAIKRSPRKDKLALIAAGHFMGSPE